jgi:multiple sugar transport system substrate-binding protein
MSARKKLFRIAIRRYGPYERAIAKQWEAFEAIEKTGLTLDAVPYDLHPLYDALFTSNGLKRGDWDVAFLNTDWMASVHGSGQVVDLAPLMAADPPQDYPAGWVSALIEQQVVDGVMLGQPYHDGPECLIYRTDVFNDSALQSEHQQRHGSPLRVPRTWDEFYRTAKFLHRPEQGRYGTIFAAYPDGHNTVYDFLLQLWSRGGELIDTAGRICFDTPEALAAMEFYRTILRDKNAVHPKCQELDSIQAGLRINEGEVAMMVNWFGFATLAHTDANSKARGLIDVAEIPSDTGNRPVSLNVYWLLSLASGSPHQKIAWKFMKHCLTPEMDKVTTTEGGIGCRKSTWNDPEVNRVMPFYSRMEGLHKHARRIPRMKSWPKIAAVIDKLIGEVIDSPALVRELLQAAEREARKAKAE